MPADLTPADQIARLEGRVSALEAALERRSRQLRQLQRHLGGRELAVLTRLESGLPPLPAGPFEPDLWRETTALTTADVTATLRDLWRSLAPAAVDPHDA